MDVKPSSEYDYPGYGYIKSVLPHQSGGETSGGETRRFKTGNSEFKADARGTGGGIHNRVAEFSSRGTDNVSVRGAAGHPIKRPGHRGSRDGSYSTFDPEDSRLNYNLSQRPSYCAPLVDSYPASDNEQYDSEENETLSQHPSYSVSQSGSYHTLEAERCDLNDNLSRRLSLSVPLSYSFYADRMNYTLTKNVWRLPAFPSDSASLEQRVEVLGDEQINAIIDILSDKSELLTMNLVPSQVDCITAGIDINFTGKGNDGWGGIPTIIEFIDGMYSAPDKKPKVMSERMKNKRVLVKNLMAEIIAVERGSRKGLLYEETTIPLMIRITFRDSVKSCDGAKNLLVWLTDGVWNIKRINHVCHKPPLGQSIKLVPIRSRFSKSALIPEQESQKQRQEERRRREPPRAFHVSNSDRRTPETFQPRVPPAHREVSAPQALPDREIPVDSSVLSELSWYVSDWMLLALYLKITKQRIKWIGDRTKSEDGYEAHDKCLKVFMKWVRDNNATWQQLGERLLEFDGAGSDINLYEQLVELYHESVTDKISRS